MIRVMRTPTTVAKGELVQRSSERFPGVVSPAKPGGSTSRTAAPTQRWQSALAHLSPAGAKTPCAALAAGIAGCCRWCSTRTRSCASSATSGCRMRRLLARRHGRCGFFQSIRTCGVISTYFNRSAGSRQVRVLQLVVQRVTLGIKAWSWSVMQWAPRQDPLADDSQSGFLEMTAGLYA